MFFAWLDSDSISTAHTDAAAAKVAVQHLHLLAKDPGFVLLPEGLRSGKVRMQNEGGCSVSGSDADGPMITRHLSGSSRARSEGLRAYVETLTRTGWHQVSSTWFTKDLGSWTGLLVVQPYKNTIEVLGMDRWTQVCVWPEGRD